MNKQQIKFYTTTIVEAALSRSTALEIEVAVSFAVMIECENNKRLAKETMLTIYNSAGSHCSKPGDIDWKTINRRINAAIALYDFTGADVVAGWAADKTKNDLIDALRQHIKSYKLKSVNEILLACEKIRPPRRNPNAPVPEGAKKIGTAHMHVIVPKSATRTELMEVATQLMLIAQSRPFTKEDVKTHQEEFANLLETN